MHRSGFVLAGGRSSRMGRDKALLPYHGTTLVQHVAQAVEKAAGSVALVGDPARYSALGYPVYRDKFPGCGPLGGIYTALAVSSTDWNLIVACDMPGVSVEVLEGLLERANGSDSDCVVAAGPTGEAEPLLAVYHRRCLPELEHAIREKRFKMRELVTVLGAQTQPVHSGVLSNVNTPAEWSGIDEESKK